MTKTVRFNKNKHFVKDWMTSSVLKSVIYKNKLYKTLILSKNNANLYAIFKINFNTYQKIFIANSFNNYFINVSKNILNNIVIPPEFNNMENYFDKLSLLKNTFS